MERVAGGEDAMGMSRAFRFAGAGNLVASLAKWTKLVLTVLPAIWTTAGTTAELEKPSASADGSVTVRLQPRQKIMGSVVNYQRPAHVWLSEKPAQKLKAEPKYRAQKPLYGVLRLGDARDNAIALAVDEPEGQPPRIYIDRNNDKDLTNDGDGAWTSVSDTCLRLAGAVIDVPYATGTIPSTFQFYRFPKRSTQSVFYYRDACRQGYVDLDGKRYKVAVLDENADGRFDDLQNGTILIDLNRDGKFEGSSDSAERHRLDAPFNIHGKVWEAASLTPDGTLLILRPSTAKVEMQTHLGLGYPAPTFSGTGLDGKPVDLKAAAAQAKYVLLDFWSSSYGSSRAGFPTIRRVRARYQKHELRVLGVSLDEDRERVQETAETAGLSYPHVFDGQGRKNAAAVLYRVHGFPQTYLVDKDLKIVAKGLRGAALEARLRELLGPGDEAAAAAVDKQFAEAASKAAKPLSAGLPTRNPVSPGTKKEVGKAREFSPGTQKRLDEASRLDDQVYRLWTAADGSVTFRLQPRQKVFGPLVNFPSIQLSETPGQKLKAEPKYRSKKPLYGDLKLGDAADNTIAVVVDEVEGQPSRIYIDRNNDKDLTNDGNGEWTKVTNESLCLADVVIDVPYKTGSVPYTFGFNWWRASAQFSYYGRACREGYVDLDGKHYKVAVLDENADGRFDDLRNGTFLIDLNRDGKFASGDASPERYGLQETFEANWRKWKVVSLTPDGLQITLCPANASSRNSLMSEQLYLRIPARPSTEFGGMVKSERLTANQVSPVDVIESRGARFLVAGEGSSWSPHGTRIVFGRRPAGSGLRVIELKSGAVSSLVPAGRNPAWSAGDDSLIAYVRESQGREELWVVEPTGKDARKLANGAAPCWSGDGRVLFYDESGTRRVMSIMPRVLGSQPQVVSWVATGDYSVSPDGHSIACIGSIVGNDLRIIEAEGGRERFVRSLSGWRGGLIAWAPDGKRVGFGGRYSFDACGLWIADIELGRVFQLFPGDCTMPAWPKDGKSLTFDKRSGDKPGIWLIEGRAYETLLAAAASGTTEPDAASSGARPTPPRKPISPARQKELDEAIAHNRRVYQLWWSGKHKEAIPLAEKALEVRRGTLGDDDLDTAVCLFNLGALHFALKDYERAEPYWWQAYRIRAKLLGRNNPKGDVVGRSLLRLQEAVRERNRCEAAIEELLWPSGRFDKAAAKPLSAEQRTQMDQAATLSSRAMKLLEENSYRDAIPLAESAMSLRRAAVGMEHPKYASSQFLIGLLHEALGDYPKADASYRCSLRIRNDSLRVDDPDYATNVVRLGALCRKRLEYSEAEPFLRAGVLLCERAKGERSLEYADALTNMGWWHEDSDEYAEAERFYEQALEILRRSGDDTLPEYAQVLRTLADLYGTTGKPAEGEERMNQSIEICRRVRGENHPEYAACLNSLAWLEKMQGKLAEATSHCQQALDIRKRIFGECHPVTCATMNDLGNIYWAQRAHLKAELLFRQSIDIHKRVFGEKNVGYAVKLERLAEFLFHDMRFPQAEAMYRESTVVRDQVQGPVHQQRVKGLIDVGIACYSMGDYQRARKPFSDAKEIIESTLGESHPDYAEVLLQIAWLDRFFGQNDKAEDLMRQSLEICGRVFGKDHFQYARRLNDLGVILRQTGRADEAESAWRQALDIYDRTVAESDVNCAFTAGNLGELYASRGDYTKAMPFYERGARIRKNLSGEKDPRFAWNLHGLGWLHQQLGHDDEAARLLKQALQIRLDYARNMVRWMPEAQALAAMASADFAPRADTLLSSLRRNRADNAAEAYKAVWETRAFATRILAERHEHLPDSPPAESLRNQLQTIRERIAQLAIANVEPQQQPMLWFQLSKLTEEKERLETKLATLSAEFSRSQRIERASFTDLAALLDKNTAVIDFLRVWFSEGRAKQSQDQEASESPPADSPTKESKTAAKNASAAPSGAWHYECFVLRKSEVAPGYTLTWLDVGDASESEDAVTRWRRGILKGDPTVQRPPEAILRRRLWDPIEPHLSGCATVIVIPDAFLNRMPWCALPGRRPGTCLIEDYAIATASYGHQLYALLTEPRGHGEGLLAVGDVAYDEQPSLATDPAAMLASADIPRSRAPAMSGPLQWPPLPATRAEVEATVAAWKRSPVTVLTGRDANELAIRKQVAGCRYFHIASHGFFADPRFQIGEDPESGATQQPTATDQEMLRRRSWTSVRNPLILSGLVLAGANMSPSIDKNGIPTGQDGILTAEEIAGLDLRNTELVVLSACDTGLGQVAGGEGVMGLTRAFHLAGARNVVASLWKVDDKATAVLMQLFYHHLWVGKKPPIEALRYAQLTLYRHPELVDQPGQLAKFTESRGLNLAKPEPVPVAPPRPSVGFPPRTAPVKQWAAFILSGLGQ